jgi:UDP-glucose 4-epimerase
MYIIIFGSNGFIGRHLTNSLQNFFKDKSDINIVGVTNIDEFLSESNTPPGSIIVDCVGVKPFFFNSLTSFQPDNIKTISLISRYNKITKFCEGNNHKFIFLSSGGTVYGRYRGRPWKENDWLDPVDDYGKACALIEKLVLSVNGKIIRGSNIYGSLKSNKQKQGLITEILLSYKFNNHINLYNQGKTVRDFLYIDDFISGLIRIVENIQISPDILNLSSGEGITQMEIVNEIDLILGSYGLQSLESQIVITSETIDLIGESVLDSNLFSNYFGDLKKTHIEDGIKNTMKGLSIIK